MATATIDPTTGERVEEQDFQIDPNTGERIEETPSFLAKHFPKLHEAIKSHDGGMIADGRVLAAGLDEFSHFLQPQKAKDFVKDIENTHVPGGLNVPAAMVADVVTSPMSYIGGLGSLLKKGGEKLVPATTKLFSMASRVSPEALTEASTAAGRQGLKDVAEKADDMGPSLSKTFQDFEKNQPEHAQVEKILTESKPVDIRGTLKAFDEAKSKSFGPMGANTPGRIALNEKIEGYKRAISGSLPSEEEIAKMDFAGNLDKAREALADPQSKWGVLKDISDKAKDAAKKSVSTANKAGENLAQSTGKVSDIRGKTATGEAVETGDLIQALDNAKADAEAAQVAYDDAQAKVAVGQLTAQDAAKAKAELDRANKAYHVADAANDISQGADISKVAAKMVKDHKLKGGELRSVLDLGRNAAGKHTFTPNYEISAQDFKRLREALDRDIDFSTEEGRAINEVLKIPRGQMRQALIDASPKEYADLMKKWHDKLEVKSRLEELAQSGSDIGSDRKAASFLASVWKKTPDAKVKRDALIEFDKVAGTDFLKQSKQAFLADQKGYGAKPWERPTDHGIRLPFVREAASGLGSGVAIPTARATEKGLNAVGTAGQVAAPVAVSSTVIQRLKDAIENASSPERKALLEKKLAELESQ